MAKAMQATPKVGNEKNVKVTYEMMFILEPGANDKARNATLSMIRETIASAGGVVNFEDLTWGERLMTYQIKGKDYGYYGVFGFDAPVTAVKDIDENLGIEPEVLRFMTIRTPENYKFVKYAEVKEHYDIFPAAPKEERRNTRAAKPKPKPKPKPKTQDKKLDDILSEEI